MPTVVTLRPNATFTPPPANTVWSGGAYQASTTAHTALSDTGIVADLTQLRATTTYTAILDLDTYTLAGNERCLRVRVGQRGYDTTTMDMQSRLRSGGIMSGAAAFTLVSGTNYFNNYGVWVPGPPDLPTTEWLQAKIDALRLQIDTVAQTGPPAPYAEMATLWVELDIHIKPSVSVASPVSGQTLPFTNSLIQWDYSGDTDPQKKYRMKVYDKAIVEAGTFDPATATPVVYDSGEIQSSATSAAAGSLVDGGDYYVYMRVAKDFNGQDWWSDWSGGRSFRINAKPTATVTAPTNPANTTSRPTVIWTYGDYEGDPQTNYKVKIMQRPGASWPGGYDPAFYTPVWDSGPPWTTSYSQSVRITTPLQNLTNYRAYVKVRHLFPVTKNSDWAYIEFNTNYPIPGAPTLMLSGGPVDRIMLTLIRNGSVADGQVQFYAMQRSLDGGATWNYFRYGTSALSDVLPEILAASGTPPSATYYDYEVPPGVPVMYRAWAATTSTGEEFDSIYATASSQIDPPLVWLKDPIDATKNRHFVVQDEWLPMANTKIRMSQRALGRPLPIILRQTSRGYSFTVQFLTQGKTDHDALLTLLESERTLFLMHPKGGLYVEVSGDYTDSPHLWDKLSKEADLWTVQVPFTEVDF